jgi:hypothetical protein
MSGLKNSLTILISVLTACTSHTAGPGVTPYPPQPGPSETVTRIIPTNSTWQFAPSEQTHTYQSTSYTVIHEVSAVRPHTDTVKLSTHFTIKLNQVETPTIISGYIDSVTVIGNSGPTIPLNQPQSRVGFTGEVRDGVLTLKLSAGQADCTSSMTPILGEIRPVITTHATTLSLTSVWTDSISTITCSGSVVPTSLNAVRSYRILGETTYSGIQALVIERTEATRFNGAGSQGQHQVQIEGIGKATSRIYLAIADGATIAVENTQEIDTTIRSSAVQRFVQEITQKIQRIP